MTEIDLTPYEELGIAVTHSQLKNTGYFVYHKGIGIAERCEEHDLQKTLSSMMTKVEAVLWQEEQKKKLGTKYMSK